MGSSLAHWKEGIISLQGNDYIKRKKMVEKDRLAYCVGAKYKVYAYVMNRPTMDRPCPMRDF